MGDISPVKVTVDLTESVNKITDTILTPIQDIHKGIKKIFAVCTGKRLADMERPTALAAAQTEKYVEDIKAGKKEFHDGNLIPVGPVLDAGDYYKEISAQNSACDAKRLGEAMLDAAIELKEIPEDEISDEPVDQTFFNHWRREAELIDDDELRKWWAHLLVEETKKPNSISPRTLDVAKNLSKYEAHLFETIAKAVVGHTVLVNSSGGSIWGDYSVLLGLQDAGLLASSDSTRTIEADPEDPPKNVLVPFLENKLVVAYERKIIMFRCHVLTKAGREIYQLIRKPLLLEEIRTIAKELSIQNNMATPSIYQMCNISQTSENTIHYDVDRSSNLMSQPEEKDLK